MPEETSGIAGSRGQRLSNLSEGALSVQETVVLAFHQGVTTAAGGMQLALVQNLDSPATVVDDLLLLESSRRGSDAAAPHAEHLSDGFLRSAQLIRTDSIVGHQ